MHEKVYSQRLWGTPDVRQVLAIIINQIMGDIGKGLIDDKWLMRTLTLQ